VPFLSVLVPMLWSFLQNLSPSFGREADAKWEACAWGAWRSPTYGLDKVPQTKSVGKIDVHYLPFSPSPKDVKIPST
jgi:hypothetical protein